MAFAYVGPLQIEFVQCTEGRIFQSRFLDVWGEGVHHIGCYVDEMEEKAWNKVKEVIEHPKMILAELKKRADASRSGNGRIEKEIARIQKRIATNDSQQQRLLTLFGNGGIDESAVVGKLSQLNKEKQEFEEQINRLSKSIEQKIDINAAKEKIEQYCKRVRVNLDKCTLQDKKKALNALDVEIVAIPQEMKIRIAVPLEFITIERTWA